MPPVPPASPPRATIMGLGRFGGGAGVTRWLAGLGTDILLTDLASEADLAAPLDSLRGLIDSGAVTLRLGGHNVSDFTNTDLVVANPAVPAPWSNRFLRAAQAAGVPVTTEIRLLVERLPSRERVIGVTGTVGKSTTAAMTALALRAVAPDVTTHLGGNIGGSLLESVSGIGPKDFVVLELSSAQLHWLGDAGAESAKSAPWSPGVAVLTNLAANHFDWHGSMEHYAQSKRHIVRAQAPGDVFITSPADGQPWPQGPGDRVVYIDPLNPAADPWPVDSALRLALPGAHNRLNARFAVAAAVSAALRAGDANPAGAHALAGAAADALRTFEGLPHRLALVRRFPAPGAAGSDPPVLAYDDSKCSTPAAAVIAINAFSKEQGGPGVARVHLIAGGYDKKISLAPLIEAARSCARVYTIGATGPDIAAALGNAEECGTLERAIEAAAAPGRLRPGDVLLLSPGCASWDQFSDFRARGRLFVDLVNRM